MYGTKTRLLGHNSGIWCHVNNLCRALESLQGQIGNVFPETNFRAVIGSRSMSVTQRLLKEDHQLCTLALARGRCHLNSISRNQAPFREKSIQSRERGSYHEVNHVAEGSGKNSPCTQVFDHLSLMATSATGGVHEQLRASEDTSHIR